MNKIIRVIAGTITGAFALLTLFMSTSVIFDLFGIRAKEGNYVLFIVIANFFAGFTYLAAAYGFFTSKKWTSLLLAGTSAVLLISFIALLIHANAGGLYETKTVKAMIFRMSFTVVLSISSYLLINLHCKRIKNE